MSKVLITLRSGGTVETEVAGFRRGDESDELVRVGGELINVGDIKYITGEAGEANVVDGSTEDSIRAATQDEIFRMLDEQVGDGPFMRSVVAVGLNDGSIETAGGQSAIDDLLDYFGVQPEEGKDPVEAVQLAHESVVERVASEEFANAISQIGDALFGADGVTTVAELSALFTEAEMALAESIRAEADEPREPTVEEELNMGRPADGEASAEEDEG